MVYAEDCEPINPDPTQITIVPQTQLTKLMAFKNKWKDVPKANGKCPFLKKDQEIITKNLNGTQ